jgi:hypothetical protein
MIKMFNMYISEIKEALPSLVLPDMFYGISGDEATKKKRFNLCLRRVGVEEREARKRSKFKEWPKVKIKSER